MSKKTGNKKKVRIKLQVKKASKVFSTLISRGPNRIKQEPRSIDSENGDKDGAEQFEKSKRVFSPLACHALCKQLEGSCDLEEGTTGLWAMRTSKGYGSILKQDYDFSERASKEEYKIFLRAPIPAAALMNASKYRIFWYERLFSTSDIVHALMHSPVTLSFKIFKGMYGAAKGLVPFPKFWEFSKENHSVAIVGYDEEKQLFRFVNSWGKEWGDGGFGYLPYAYVDKYLVESWIWMTDVRKPGQRGLIKCFGQFEFEFLTYRSLIAGRQHLHVIDVYKAKTIVGWIHYRPDKRSQSIEIEEIFVMPSFRKQKIASLLLDCLEDEARQGSISSILGFIHIQDLLSEENVLLIENLFHIDKGYKISHLMRNFRGFEYKIEKMFTA